MKSKIAMKIFDNLNTLENKFEDLLKIAQNKIIKSLTNYEFCSNVFNSIFKD